MPVLHHCLCLSYCHFLLVLLFWLWYPWQRNHAVNDIWQYTVSKYIHIRQQDVTTLDPPLTPVITAKGDNGHPRTLNNTYLSLARFAKTVRAWRHRQYVYNVVNVFWKSDSVFIEVSVQTIYCTLRIIKCKTASMSYNVLHSSMNDTTCDWVFKCTCWGCCTKS